MTTDTLIERMATVVELADGHLLEAAAQGHAEHLLGAAQTRSHTAVALDRYKTYVAQQTALVEHLPDAVREVQTFAENHTDCPWCVDLEMLCIEAGFDYLLWSEEQ